MKQFRRQTTWHWLSSRSNRRFVHGILVIHVTESDPEAPQRRLGKLLHELGVQQATLTSLHIVLETYTLEIILFTAELGALQEIVLRKFPLYNLALNLQLLMKHLLEEYLLIILWTTSSCY